MIFPADPKGMPTPFKLSALINPAPSISSSLKICTTLSERFKPFFWKYSINSSEFIFWNCWKVISVLVGVAKEIMRMKILKKNKNWKAKISITWWRRCRSLKGWWLWDRTQAHIRNLREIIDLGIYWLQRRKKR